MEGVELDKLESASYSYQLWRQNPSDGKKSIIAASSSPVSISNQEVPCPVPGDNWHFAVSPVGGWIPVYQLVLAFVLVLFLTALIPAGAFHRASRHGANRTGGEKADTDL